MEKTCDCQGLSNGCLNMIQEKKSLVAQMQPRANLNRSKGSRCGKQTDQKSDGSAIVKFKN